MRGIIRKETSLTHKGPIVAPQDRTAKDGRVPSSRPGLVFVASGPVVDGPLLFTTYDW